MYQNMTTYGGGSEARGSNIFGSISSANPLMTNFNSFMTANPTQVPFKSNQLMTQNVHVMNQLNEMVQNQRMEEFANRRNKYTDQVEKNHQAPLENKFERNRLIAGNHPSKSSNSSSGLNIIEELLKSEKIVKNNRDVRANLKTMISEHDTSKLLEPTAQPYKIIIKDKIITRRLKKDEFEVEVIVHKTSDADKDINTFNTESFTKKTELEKINDEIDVEFHIDNYDKHKKKYDFKETLIKNMAFEAKTCGENKDDYIEFYRKKQREAEENNALCDNVLNKLLDTGIIDPKELPTDMSDELPLDVLPLDVTIGLSEEETKDDIIIGSNSELNTSHSQGILVTPDMVRKHDLVINASGVNNSKQNTDNMNIQFERKIIEERESQKAEQITRPTKVCNRTESNTKCATSLAALRKSKINR